MTTMMRKILTAMVVAGTAAAAGCAQTGLVPVEHLTVAPDGNGTRVMLEPADVWDDEGAGAAVAATVDGRTLHVRKREKGWIQQSWMRLGLYWSSRRPGSVYVAALALGPSVEVRGLRVDVGGRTVRLPRTDDFHFIPGQRGFLDGREKHAGAFEADASLIREMTEARGAVAIYLETNRGALAGDLSVVAGDDEKDLRASAKNRFAEFLEARTRAGGK